MEVEVKALDGFLGAFQTQTLAFFTAIAGVGVLSMAIIQALKDLTPIRSWFQAWWIRGWLAEKWAMTKEVRAALANTRTASTGDRSAEADLVLLATDGDADALYDLAIEQLCGQMNVAAQAALDNPGRYPELLFCLACRAQPADLDQVLHPPDAVRVQAAQEQIPPVILQNYVDARNRVTQQVQRAIDAVQISLGFRWKFWLQLASFALSALIAGIGVWWADGSRTDVASTIAIALLGGFLAPVARDLVASVQQLRK